MKNKNFIVWLYEEYFELSEEGKIREKVFVARIATSVVLIGICLYMMGFSAYAYFTNGVTSEMNTIVAASYSLDVVIPDEVTRDANGYVLENTSSGNKEFVFVLTKNGNAKVGYGKIIFVRDSVSEEYEEYFTTPIGTYTKENVEVTEETYELSIILPPNTTFYMEVVGEWGTCSSEEYIIVDNSLDFGVELTESSMEQSNLNAENEINTVIEETVVEEKVSQTDQPDDEEDDTINTDVETNENTDSDLNIDTSEDELEEESSIEDDSKELEESEELEELEESEASEELEDSEGSEDVSDIETEE